MIFSFLLVGVYEVAKTVPDQSQSFAQSLRLRVRKFSPLIMRVVRFFYTSAFAV